MAAMPAKRSQFSSLLSPVKPLPEDDEDVQAAPPPAQRSAAAPEPGPVGEPPALAADPAPLGDGTLLARITADAANTPRGKEGPPSTFRMNEQASGALWSAYLAAKNADPFVTLRQFMSAVVLDGLARAAERDRRRR